MNTQLRLASIPAALFALIGLGRLASISDPGPDRYRGGTPARRRRRRVRTEHQFKGLGVSKFVVAESPDSRKAERNRRRAMSRLGSFILNAQEINRQRFANRIQPITSN